MSDKYPHNQQPQHGHDHDHDAIEGRELATLTSVGIDIGSSTSHLMFSWLRIGYPVFQRRQPMILERRVLSRSPVLLTPFSDDWTIQVEPLKELIHNAFEEARLSPAEIDTGAVIITGQAALRHNAKRIAELFSHEAGRFVCATAGARLETVLAANGSGGVHLSRDHGLNLLNIDVGGGTTKVALLRQGRLIATAAFNIGARLVAFDLEGRVTRLEEAGARLLQDLGRRVALGERLDGETQFLLARRMADLLFKMLQGEKPPWSELIVVPFSPGFSLPGLDGVLFSGGVSEYVYEREQITFGDLGSHLGRELKQHTEALGLPLLESHEGLRATVIGASQYSIQMSGETIYIPDEDRLPLRNLRVFSVFTSWDQPIGERAEKAIFGLVRSLDHEVQGDPFALAILTPPFLGYGVALELAEGIRRALNALGPEERPQALVFQQNIGQIVGKVLASSFHVPCIDEVSLSELDFIDIGRPVEGGSFVPVVVKSLAFGA